MEGVATTDATRARCEMQWVIESMQIATPTTATGKGADGNEEGALVMDQHVNLCLEARMPGIRLLEASWVSTDLVR
ncbi:MAG: hypothetical protein SGPRY_005601 [Prymnesium sp.]